MLAALFDPNVAFGLLGPLILILGLLAAGYAYLRSNAAKVWEENAQAYRERVDWLEKENARQKLKIVELEARVHELEARPDMDRVVQIIGKSHEQTVAAVKAALESVATAIASGREASVSEIMQRIDSLERRRR